MPTYPTLGYRTFSRRSVSSRHRETPMQASRSASTAASGRASRVAGTSRPMPSTSAPQHGRVDAKLGSPRSTRLWKNLPRQSIRPRQLVAQTNEQLSRINSAQRIAEDRFDPARTQDGHRIRRRTPYSLGATETAQRELDAAIADLAAKEKQLERRRRSTGRRHIGRDSTPSRRRSAISRSRANWRCAADGSMPRKSNSERESRDRLDESRANAEEFAEEAAIAEESLLQQVQRLETLRDTLGAAPSRSTWDLAKARAKIEECKVEQRARERRTTPPSSRSARRRVRTTPPWRPCVTP